METIYRAKHLPSQNGTYGDTGFYGGQTYTARLVLNELKDCGH